MDHDKHGGAGVLRQQLEAARQRVRQLELALDATGREPVDPADGERPADDGGAAARPHDALAEAIARLKRSGAPFDALFDAMQVGVLVQRADGAIVYANAVAQRVFGMSADDILSRTSVDPVWQMVDEHGQPVPGSEHPSMITLRGGEPLRGVVRGLFHGDEARTRWLLITTEPVIEHPDDAPVAVLVSFFDITERRRMEVALAEQEAELRMLLEHQNDLVLKLAADGRVVYASPSCCEMFGRPRRELLGLPFMQLLHPDDRAAAQLALHALRRSPHRTEHAERALTSRGWRWLRWSARATLDQRGALESVVSVGRDITAQVEAEEELRLTLDAVTEGVWKWDKRLGDVQFSPRYETLLGYDVGELDATMEGWLQLVHPDDRRSVQDRMQAFLSRPDQRTRTASACAPRMPATAGSCPGGGRWPATTTAPCCA